MTTRLRTLPTADLSRTRLDQLRALLDAAFAGRELLRPGLAGRLRMLDKKTMRARAEEAFTSMGTDVKDLDAPVGALSGGQRQSVAICRAVMWARRVVIMDEPTAALGVRQTGKVLELVRRVAGTGVAVVLISHNMPEVLAVADRVQVLRLGRRSPTWPPAPPPSSSSSVP